MAALITLVCSGCGDDFQRKEYNVVDADDYYCSQSCRREEGDLDCPWDGCSYTSDSELGIKQHHKRTHGVSLTEEEFECDWCGELFTRQRSKVEYWDGTFCSTECRASSVGDDLSERREGDGNPMYGRTGEAHHRWAGGYNKNYGAGWRQARRQTLERDGYECQDCGMGRETHKQVFGYDLEVHHKTPFREFADASAANQLSNLITLCTNCHMNREHSIE